jgi:hypothetical protein
VIDSYFQVYSDDYEDRALVLSYKFEAKQEDDNLARYAANDNIWSPRSRRATSGGPVLVIPSDLRLLHEAIRLADNQILGVREYRPRSMLGWAAATGAPSRNRQHGDAAADTRRDSGASARSGVANSVGGRPAKSGGRT